MECELKDIVADSIALTQIKPKLDADVRKSFRAWATALTDRSDEYHLDAVCLDNPPAGRFRRRPDISEVAEAA